MKKARDYIALIAIVFIANMPVHAQTLDSYSWDTSNNSNVSTVPWTKQNISAFLATFPSIGEEVRIADFKFKNMLGDQAIWLVASADFSGRDFFNAILLIRKNEEGGGFSIQNISALNVESLSDVILDIDGDGKQELVVPTELTPYLGGPFPQLKWRAIYTSLEFAFVEDSARFRSYYQSILPKFQEALVSAKATNDSLAVLKAQLEYDKALRLTMPAGSDNGIETAYALAGESEPNLRIWAAAILADIGSSASLQRLSTLTMDTDKIVVLYARSAKTMYTQSRCTRLSISVSKPINLASNRPIQVAVSISPQRGAEKKIFQKGKITFGQAGIEESLISCNDGNSNGVACLFRAKNTGLQVGDGVAALRARFTDGTCGAGLASVSVIEAVSRP